MFKQFTMAALVAALAVIMMPSASQAGGAHRGEARASCGITKMFSRAGRHSDRATRKAARRDRHHRHHHRARAHKR